MRIGGAPAAIEVDGGAFHVASERSGFVELETREQEQRYEES
jgi:hypothetical protein